MIQDFGVRFLDLRVTGKGTSDDLWTSHTFLAQPLKPVLEEIKRFLDETKEEIVVVQVKVWSANSTGVPSHIFLSSRNVPFRSRETTAKLYLRKVLFAWQACWWIYLEQNWKWMCPGQFLNL